jgi:hypothetical protein
MTVSVTSGRAGASVSARVALPIAIALMLVAGCGRTSSPEDVALSYSRALYANDGDAIWSLVSSADHRAKDGATFRRQQQIVEGFARELLGQLGGYVSATPVATSVRGDRARVTLKLRLPDANAAAISDLAYGWDEKRLNELPADARARIRAGLERLRRTGTMPIVEGEESFDLVREQSGWRMDLHWARGVRIEFAAVHDPALPLRVAVEPASPSVARGERLRVTLSVTNVGGREIETRVRHRIEPDSDSGHLALLQCPLLLPVRLPPGATRGFVSEYLLLADAPDTLEALHVVYRFPGPPGRGQSRRSRSYRPPP